MAFEFGGTEVSPGTATWTEMPVADDADGGSMDVPALVVAGEADGPTLWAQACVHGDEHTGAVALREFATGLSPADVAGSLVAVPVANRTAFVAKSRESPLDGQDLNRSFPGSADGAFSDRLAAALLSAAAEHADAFVDLHTGRRETYIEGYSIFSATGDAVETTARELCVAAALPHVIGLPPADLPGTMFAELADRGVPSIITETGGEGRLHPEHVAAATRSLRNVACEVGLLDGEPEIGRDDGGPGAARHPRFHDGMTFLKAPTGGLFELAVGTDNVEVAEGDVLARITRVRGETAATMRAPHDGVVVSSRTFGAVRPGDPAFELAPV